LSQQKIITVGLDYGKHTDLYSGVYKGNDVNQTNLLPSFHKGTENRSGAKKVENLYKLMNMCAPKGSKTIE